MTSAWWTLVDMGIIMGSISLISLRVIMWRIFRQVEQVFQIIIPDPGLSLQNWRWGRLVPNPLLCLGVHVGGGGILYLCLIYSISEIIFLIKYCHELFSWLDYLDFQSINLIEKQLTYSAFAHSSENKFSMGVCICPVG